MVPQKTYFPLWCRAAPFVIGAITAFRYTSATTTTEAAAQPPSSKRAVPTFALACIAPLALLLSPLDPDALPPPPVTLAMDVLGPAILSAALAHVALCASVPPSHPLHAPMARWLMSRGCFTELATASGGRHVAGVGKSIVRISADRPFNLM